MALLARSFNRIDYRGTYLCITKDTQIQVKHILLSRVVTEDDGNVGLVGRTIANAFTVFGGENGWPELSVFINQCVEVDNDLLKETAMLILANLLEQSTNVATRDESTFILEMLLVLLIHKPLDDRTKNLVKQTLLRCVEREDDRNTYIEAAKIVVKQGHAPDDIAFVARAGLFEAAMDMINNMEKTNQASSRRTDELSESVGSAGGHWKSRVKKAKSSVEDDLSQPWVCEETDPFTPRICYFYFPKTRMPSHIKTYDGSEDPEDHLKIFLSAAKTERWAIPTWCHNSTLTRNARVWFDDLPRETIDSYDDLKKTFFKSTSSGRNTLRTRSKSITPGRVTGSLQKSLYRGETAGKDKAIAIPMVQPWERVARQRITQSFSPNSKISFPPLGEDAGREGPMIIEAKIGGHCVHRMYVDGGSASEILYENRFSRLYLEIKRQLIPATTPLIGFSREIIWPIGQIQLLVTIGDEEHSTSALMNFVVVRSPSPYNGFIGRSGVRKLQAEDPGRWSRLVPLECAMVSRPERTLPANETKVEEMIKVAVNPEYSEQTIMIESTLT
ncbi:reverse transcriptase domain-containing protein [Tanacetum coccineum]